MTTKSSIFVITNLQFDLSPAKNQVYKVQLFYKLKYVLNLTKSSMKTNPICIECFENSDSLCIYKVKVWTNISN